MTESLDSRQLMAEIEADARARRASGAVPRDLEEELEAKFAALTPRGVERSFAAAIQRAQVDALFDYQPPVASEKPGGTAAKKGLAKLSSWYIRHIGQQVTAFGLSITNAVRILGDRVQALEAQVGVAGVEGVSRIAERVLPRSDETEWESEIVAALKRANGRILVADAGNGVLLRPLVDAGYDAYGVEPRDPEDSGDVDASLDIRTTSLATHLRGVGDATLAGIVLIGVSDVMTVGGLHDLTHRLREVLRPGGVLVAVSTDPEQWRRMCGGLMADLSFGGPLAPRTWSELLVAAGFSDIEVQAADPEPIIGEIPGLDPQATLLMEQLKALEAAVAVPPSYCIRALRSE